MAVPKTAVNEYDNLIPSKNNIWLARQTSCVQSKAESMPV
jgi:hypothetical protein